MSSPASKLIARRVAARRGLAERLAARARARLAKLGVRTAVAGSLARGKFRLHSDIDLVILDAGGVSEGRILRTVEEAVGDFPVDVIWPDRIAPDIAEKILETLDAGPVRPA